MVSRQKNRSRNARKSLARKAAAQTPITKPSRLRVEQLEDRMLLSGGVTPFSHEWYIQKYGADPRLHLNVAPADPTHLEQAPGGPAGQLIPQLLPPGVAGPINMVPGSAVHAGPNQNLQYNINWFHDQGGEDHSRPDNGNDGSDRFTTLGGQNSVNDQPVQHVGQGHWRLSPDNGHESPELPGNPPIVLNNVLVNDPTADGPDINTQSETTVVAFGSNVIAGYNDSESFSGFGTHFTGYSLSTDGGNTFTDLGHLPDSSLGDAGDPVIARDNVTGRIYFSTLDFSTFTNIPVFRSDDGGATFQQPVNGSPLGGSSDLDKDWLTVDNFDGPGQGNVYVVVRDFGAGNGIYLTRSTDHGDTYGPSGGVFIVGGGNFNVQGPDVVVGPDHAVYVFWHDQSSGFGGPVSIMMRKSTDQGQTFGPAVTVANLNTTGVNGDLGFNFRSNAFPRVAVNPVNGALYLSYADFPNDGTGDRANIYFTQSLDGGATWSSPLKVNDDEGTTDQWQPAIAVKPNGSQVFIGFYDRRLDPTNTAIDTFGAVGDVDPTTGAITFEANFRISTESFPEAFGNDPVVNPSYMSDYDTADADNTYFYYTWGDNRLLNTTGVRHQADVRMAKILTGMTVVASTPSAGDFVSTPISDFVVTFSNPYDPATVDASDLTVNGIPADSVDQTDPSTLTFHYVVSPVTTEGPQTMAMAMDAVERASDQSPLQAFTSTFYYDTQRLEVVSTTPADGSAVTLPFEHLIVHFNEAVDPSSVAASNLSITQGTVTGASVVSGDPTSVDYTLSGITQEGTLTASIGANSLRDSDGNPGPADAFSASFVLDIGTVPYPTPLAAKKPAGSLIYDPSASGTIGFAGDTDSFTINLDPNQSITVLVTPDSGLQPTVDVYSPSSAHLGGAVAGAAGSVALLQTVPAVAAGTYTVTVGGAGGTTGSYTVQIILNAALENESNGGSDNNSLGTAQSLDSTFTSLGHGASRGAVLGQSDAGSFIGPDAYGYEGLAVAPEFIDISSTGTATLQGADDSSVGLSASDLGGFTFNFYGTTYNSLAYSSNGLITFDGFDSDFVNGDLMSNPSLAAIAPFWDDLENFGDSSSAVYWQVVGSKLIIQWSNTQFYASGGLITFEAVLDSADNTIQFNYLDLDAGRPDHDGGASATVGIKDAGSQGGNALRADFNSGPNAFVGTGLSTKFGVGIVSLTPDYYSFHLNKNESATIALSNLGAGSNSFELEDSSGTTLALGHGGAPNVSQVLNNFVSSTGGTYYVRVSGAGAPYSLLVTKNSDFDTEDNSTLAHAQSLQGGHNALGHLSPAFHGETFEEGNLNAYTFLGSNNASLTAEAAHDGSLGLSAASFTDWMFRNDAEVHVQRGDVIKGWIKSETTPGGRGYMGFGASEVGTMSVVMAANTGQFIIQDNSGYGF